MKTLTKVQNDVGEKAKSNEKLGPDDWARGALKLIAEDGLAALSIPKLAKRLGVTKGSFYWHFDSLEALLNAALARWEQVYTDNRLDQFDADKNETGLGLWSDEAEVDHVSQSLYLEISNAAATREQFAKVVARVVDKRIGYIKKTLLKQGLSAPLAQRRAVIIYSGYVGLLHLVKVAPASVGNGAERQEIVREAVNALTR